MIHIILSNRHLHDLNPILIGEEACVPGHSYGPGTRSYVLIHFVVSGCGTFLYRGAAYKVSAGEAFIASQDEILEYRADTEDPWHYMWVGFDGALSRKFSSLPPVLKYSTNWAKEMLRLDRNSSTLEYNISSKLFMMYSEWFDEKRPKTDYIKAVRDHVNAKFSERISVDAIAEDLSLDRRYLSRIFKQNTGKSIQEYIIFERMEKAKQLLGSGCHIAETAQRCGYEDVCNFSKMFKKYTGVSPGVWKSKKMSY